MHEHRNNRRVFSKAAGKRDERKKSAGSAESAILRRLRLRFVTTSMSALLIIVLLMVAVINIVNFLQIDLSAQETLELLADNNGIFPDSASSRQNDAPAGGVSDGLDPSQKKEPRSFPENDINETSRIEAPYETRYFSVLLDGDGSVLSVDTAHIAAVTDDIAQDYALTVYYNGRTRGAATSYRYLATQTQEGGLLVIFVDCSSSIAEARQLMLYTIGVGVAALILMFILVWLLSGRSAAPVVESLEKQKRFISDAGHELKTPVTIISANVDVLEMLGERNEWTQSIRSQTVRMTDLINNMLTLSRMEEDSLPMVFRNVDISELVRECAASFDAVAQADGLDYSVAIRENLYVNGDPNSLRQLCTILLDNAMKYSSERGSVYLTLHPERKEGGRKGESPHRGRTARQDNVILEVSNTCDAIPEGNLERLFDRFYRADASRTRESRATWHVSSESGSGTSENARSSGGFGIGLSVARAVVTAHDGTISAHIDGDRLIRFEVVLPMQPAPQTQTAAE